MPIVILPVLCMPLLAAQAIGVPPAGSRPDDHAIDGECNGGEMMWSEAWGSLPDGRTVTLYTLSTPGGITVRISDWGGTIVGIDAPDRDGVERDVVLGFDDGASYRTRSPYFGGIIGRYANRIANGRFTLDGTLFTLATNNEPGGRPCHLHGGHTGFDQVLWTVDDEAIGKDPEGISLPFRYRSPAGQEGYPGTLDVVVTYTLVSPSTLRMTYVATTDAATPINLTNHAYFNLLGHGASPASAALPTINDHLLTIDAGRYTPVDAGLIPTGDLAPVVGTPFDFRKEAAIGSRVDQAHEQLLLAGGYDHNWVLDKPAGTFGRAARVVEPIHGRTLEVWTTEPCLQVYGGNFLPRPEAEGLGGKQGAVYRWRTGMCLESQHAPDSPNQAAFPSTILRPGQRYHTMTEYRFGTVP